MAAADSKGQCQETRWTLGPTAAQVDTATGAQACFPPSFSLSDGKDQV